MALCLLFYSKKHEEGMNCTDAHVIKPEANYNKVNEIEFND